MTTTYANGEKVSKFAESGYDSSIFWLMLGPLFLMMVIFGIFVILKKIAKLVTRKCQAKQNCILKFIHKEIKYSLIITRFLLEGCLEIGLSAIICVKMIESKNFDSFWESLSTISAFISLILLAIVPFYFIRITKSYRRDFKSN